MARFSWAATAILGACTLLGMAPPARAADPEKKPPSPKDGGKLYEAKSADGLVYFWRGPERYDAEKGVNLTLILHGSNLTHGWGFANHDAKSFRPDDLVVSPDGTTPNGNGGFNFLDAPKDGNRLHALIEELKKAFKIRATFLYGHSQGSFFSFQYAGQYPQDVNGIVAHASGLWRSSQVGKQGHHIAIVLMHGTADPVVPYGNSVGGYDALAEAGYPALRLRSLEFWNHWPAELNGTVPHTSQQLAWVEGMTTHDPDRLRACFEKLLPAAGKDERGEHDWAGLYTLAVGIAALDDAPSELKERATKVMAKVEALAQAHVDALSVEPGTAFEKKPWVAHLPMFLRGFQGVPAREALATRWKETLAAHQKDGLSHLRKYFPALTKKDNAAAFEEGVAAIVSGFLWHECADSVLRENLKTWQKDAKKLKLSKKALKDYDTVMPAFDDMIAEGWKAYVALNHKHGDVE
jgi:predicted esterase